MEHSAPRAASAAILALLTGLAAAPLAHAQSSQRDGIGELLAKEAAPSATPAPPADPKAAKQPPGKSAEKSTEKDPRAGEAAYEQARRLMSAIDDLLSDAAEQRSEARKLPAKDEFLVTPLWTETREDRETKIRALLDAALGIVTDVPVVDLQKRVEARRKAIRGLEDDIARMKEKQLTAPKSGLWGETTATLESAIEDAEARIAKSKTDILAAKREIADALAKSGMQIGPEQIDLLLDSVLADDLVRLVAVFNAAKVIDGQLGKLLEAAGDNTNAARKYFAMHAALFAMMVHAQDMAIARIDTDYIPKLDAILQDIAATRARTLDLLRAENRPDQKRALEANRESLKMAEDAARGYRKYLQQQREQIARARARAAHDLSIADNTYETVEASYQLHNLIRDSITSFEALQKLEAPTFEQIFKNEELRREFENLTRKLDAPTS